MEIQKPTPCASLDCPHPILVVLEGQTTGRKARKSTGKYRCALRGQRWWETTRSPSIAIENSLNACAQWFRGLDVRPLERRRFVGNDGELAQVRRAERSGQCDVGCIASYGHQNPANTRLVVARVESPPAILQIHFE